MEECGWKDRQTKLHRGDLMDRMEGQSKEMLVRWMEE